MNIRTGFIRMLALVAVISSWACDSSPTGIDGISLSGDWAGIATLPNGRTTSMSLSQAGITASGSMRVAGNFLDRDVTGTINAVGRTYSWGVADGCELWGGILTISSDGQSMEGDLVIDRSGCVGQSNGSGRLSLTKR